MSIPVSLLELPQQVARFGAHPYLLWPAPASGKHALIVDGWADVQGRPEVGVVLIQPSRAVLHVVSRPPESG